MVHVADVQIGAFSDDLVGATPDRFALLDEGALLGAEFGPSASFLFGERVDVHAAILRRDRGVCEAGRTRRGGGQPGPRLACGLVVVEGVVAEVEGEPSAQIGHDREDRNRVDERSMGIVVRAGNDRDDPAARGSSVAVMGHAWVVEAPGKAPTRETGAMRWSEPHARGRSAEARRRRVCGF